MAGGVRLGLKSQTIVATSYRGLTGFLLEIPPDHIQLTVGKHTKTTLQT